MKQLRSTFLAGVLGAAFIATPLLAAGTHPVTGEALADDQTFTYRLLDDIVTFDPNLIEDVESSAVGRDLFEGLMNQDNDGNLVPGVATGYDVSEDGMTYTFHLRDNAVWSDGNPVTAGDFVYSWRRLADPATASNYQWYIEVMGLVNGGAVMAGDMPTSELGVRAIDDHTLEVSISAPLSYFPQTTTLAATFPVPAWAIEEHGADWTKPGNIVTNGAYTLTEYVPMERSVRERSPSYWNNDATILDKVVTLVVSDENVALTRYFAGEFQRTEMPAGQYPSMKEQYPDQAISFPRLCNYYYTFNLSDSGPEAFKDVRVRKALSYAIDRNVITDQVLQGGQFPAYTFTPGATANFEVPAVDFAEMSQADRDAAALALLEEAGYGAENPLSFTAIYNTSEGHKKIIIAMSQMWKQKLGVDVTIENTEWATFLDIRGAQDFELARGAWCGDYNEASTFLDLLQSQSGYNDGKYSNAEVDQLMADAKTSADPSANYTAVEQILSQEMPVIPIYHYAGVYMMSPQLKNWPINNVEQRWYSRNLYIAAE